MEKTVIDKYNKDLILEVDLTDSDENLKEQISEYTNKVVEKSIEAEKEYTYNNLFNHYLETLKFKQDEYYNELYEKCMPLIRNYLVSKGKKSGNNLLEELQKLKVNK